MEKLHVIRTDKEIKGLLDYLSNPDFEYVAYDTETTSLEQDAQVIGFSVAAEPDVGWYVVLAEWRPTREDAPCPVCQDLPAAPNCNNCMGFRTVKIITGGELVWLDNRDKAIEVLRLLQEKFLVMHNGIVDVQWTQRNFGVWLMDALHTDTMILAHLINENRLVGLKELGFTEFGEEAKAEQAAMQASVIANGGAWETKRGGNKEMYKADPELMGRYGAKDTVLTLKLFYKYIPQLFDQNLDAFFYEDESMPLFRGPTYELNTVGLKVDTEGMKTLEHDLTVEIAKLKEQIYADIFPYVREDYPGTRKTNTFNINAGQQMAWLLFVKLDNDWKKLTDKGRELAKTLLGKAPYNPSGRAAFERILAETTDEKGRPLKLQKYVKCDKGELLNFAAKYKWVERLLKYKQLDKLLKTYVLGIQARMRYGVIHPAFLQHGTTGGRYSSRNPNFQNLPRKDKRVKKCIIARLGKVFVGADYSQLEPRTFASFSQDERLMGCFASGEDFYSVIGIDIFEKYDAVPLKEGHDKAFGVLYPTERDLSKGVALSATYGTTAYKLSDLLRGKDGKNLPIDECEDIIRRYFEQYPKVKKLQLDSHKQAIENGYVINLFGRPRRIPEAKFIKSFGKVDARELPYEYRTLLNLAVNHRIQSTAASIVNRAAIAFYLKLREHGITDCHIVMQIHDELVVECKEQDAPLVVKLLKDAMENTVTLPGVALVAEPKVARNLADLK